MSEPTAGQTRGFLFADLRDYTRFVESHGDQAAAELLTRYRLLVRGVIVQSDGAEIRTEGDSFYVVFPSASAAVRGGLAILDAAAAAGSEAGTGAIKVGIGVHAGETAETPEGFVGSAVNLAARLCALAGPGELLVSDTVRGLTRTFLGVQFVPLGAKQLKGISEPVQVYRVLPAGAPVGPTISEPGADGRRRRWLAAGAVVVAIVLLSVVALIGSADGIGPLGGASPSASSGGAPTGSSAPSSNEPAESDAASPALTAAEAELVARLPAAIKGDCKPASVAEGSAGGSVSLHCQLPLSAEAAEVWVDEFSSPQALDAAYAEAVALALAPAGDCGKVGRADGTWQIPNVRAGRVLCYPTDGAVWLIWTYEADRILARARREGSDPGELYRWWRETAIFLR